MVTGGITAKQTGGFMSFSFAGFIQDIENIERKAKTELAEFDAWLTKEPPNIQKGANVAAESSAR